MKSGIATFLALTGLLLGASANPVPANQLARRTTNLDQIFAQVESHTSAARMFTFPCARLLAGLPIKTNSFRP